MSHTARWILKAILIASAAILLGLFFAARTAAQKSHEKEWQPAMIPAAALKYGAEIEAAAGPQFSKWVHAFVQKEMRAMAVSPKETMGVVDKQFAGTPDEARDAGIFLAMYLAYRDEAENQRMLAGQVRENERKIYDLNRQLQIMWENEQNNMTSRKSSMTAETRVRNDEAGRQIESQLKELLDQQHVKMAQMKDSQKKVNLYLKALQITHERMNGIPAKAVSALK